LADSALQKADHFEGLDKVVQLYLRGENAPKIARQLRLRVSDVESYLQEWRYYIRHNQGIQDKAADTLHVADSHLDKILREVWAVIDEATDSSQLSVKNIALKNAAEITFKRVEMLNRAGLNDAESMANIVLENEQKVAKILGLLKELSQNCSNCRSKIINELHKFNDEASPIIVQDFSS
jgi:hypothetical protein